MRTVFLTNNGLLHLSVLANGVEVQAVIDSGASVNLVSRRILKDKDIFPGQVVQVQGYDGQRRSYSDWTRLEVIHQDRSFTLNALVMDQVSYDLLLSRPSIKEMRLNIFWNDTISIDMSEACLVQRDERIVRCAEDVPRLFPELQPVGDYPPATTKFEVPFRLRDTTVVRKKPYQMSREKKQWLKEELRGLLDAGIIRPSTSSFASPITIAPK